MKRYYITPKEKWAGEVYDLSGNAVNHTVDAPMSQLTYVRSLHDPPPEPMPAEIRQVAIPMRNIDLFNPSVGSHYIDIEDGNIVMTACLDHSEYCSEIWHNYTEVGRAPHPVYEGNVTLNYVAFDDEIPQVDTKFPLDDHITAAVAYQKKNGLKAVGKKASLEARIAAIPEARMQHIAKNLRLRHVDALTRSKNIPADGTDTVLSLARKAGKVHPLMKLSAGL